MEITLMMRSMISLTLSLTFFAPAAFAMQTVSASNYTCSQLKALVAQYGVIEVNQGYQTTVFVHSAKDCGSPEAITHEGIAFGTRDLTACGAGLVCGEAPEWDAPAPAPYPGDWEAPAPVPYPSDNGGSGTPYWNGDWSSGNG